MQTINATGRPRARSDPGVLGRENPIEGPSTRHATEPSIPSSNEGIANSGQRYSMSHLNVWLLTSPAESMVHHLSPHDPTLELEPSSGATAEVALNHIPEDEAFEPDVFRQR